MSPWGDQTCTLEGNKKTSEKEQTDKIGSPSSHSPQRYLTTIYRPKYHCENSGKQLRYCNTPDDLKAKNSHIDVGKKNCFALLMIAPLSSWHSSTLEDNTPGHGFSPLGGRGVECESCILAFWRAARGLVSVSPDLWHWQETGILWMPGRPWEQERARQLASENQRTCSAAGRHQREQEIMISWNRNQQAFLIEELLTQAQRSPIPYKSVRECLIP